MKSKHPTWDEGHRKFMTLKWMCARCRRPPTVRELEGVYSSGLLRVTVECHGSEETVKVEPRENALVIVFGAGSCGT